MLHGFFWACVLPRFLWVYGVGDDGRRSEDAATTAAAAAAAQPNSVHNPVWKCTFADNKARRTCQ